MRRLILIRHAKSSWKTPVNDYMRNLSNRGIQDAHLVSDELKEWLPDSFIVWSSGARRAKETAVIFCQNMNIPIESIVEKEALYTFGLRQLETAVKECENKHQNLILFGHNDAITNFVNKFGDRSILNVPTSGVVIIEFPSESWKSIEKGRIVKQIFPKDLKHDKTHKV